MPSAITIKATKYYNMNLNLSKVKAVTKVKEGEANDKQQAGELSGQLCLSDQSLSNKRQQRQFSHDEEMKCLQ